MACSKSTSHLNVHNDECISEVTLSIVVNANEYYRQLTHQAHLRIQAVCALAPESGCGSDEAFMKTHNFIFRRPVLEITVRCFLSTSCLLIIFLFLLLLVYIQFIGLDFSDKM